MIIIRNMTTDDLDFAASCTAAEGWVSENRVEFEGFLAHDPAGCIIAEDDASRVGIGAATSYGEYGFVGDLVVVEEMRGRGIGRMLLARCVSYLQQRGGQRILLDGMPRAVSLYERFGFKRICRSLRFYGTIIGKRVSNIRHMRNDDFQAVTQLDRQSFGADRSLFLARRLSIYPELCKVLEQEGRLAGFILGRGGEQSGSYWTSAGPWVTTPAVGQVEDLLLNLPAEGSSLQLSLGVLETNLAAVSLIRGLGFSERADSPWRMVLGGPGNLGDNPSCYAVGTSAKG
jgi:ribosomal protein S18 acetylase RimI-like enzyme